MLRFISLLGHWVVLENQRWYYTTLAVSIHEQLCEGEWVLNEVRKLGNTMSKVVTQVWSNGRFVWHFKDHSDLLLTDFSFLWLAGKCQGLFGPWLVILFWVSSPTRNLPAFHETDFASCVGGVQKCVFDWQHNLVHLFAWRNLQVQYCEWNARLVNSIYFE